MKEASILVLDLEGGSLGGDLERVLVSSVERPLLVRREELQVREFPPNDDTTISALLRDSCPDLVFLVISPEQTPFIRSLSQDLVRGTMGLPVIAVVEGCRSEELFGLLQGGGITDFVTPPLKAGEILPRVWRILVQKGDPEPLVRRLKGTIGLRQLVGKSEVFQREIEKIPVVARCDSNVLVTGETGTGKELCARAIHYMSPRSGGPFIPVNCGAIPMELVENELFGHARGAFTGAHAEHAGLIQDAHGGTVFLDEIDCLPLGAQVKLLRFLQDKEYRQLGSARVIRADVRVIAATNIDLEKAVKEGKFRQDLYYRLNIVPVSLPPLRDRKEDMPLLARHFLHKHSSDLERDVEDFTSEALRKLTLYDWPGNVRELENVIERTVVFSVGRVIDASDIALPDVPQHSEMESFHDAKANAVEKFEKDYLRSLLITHGGNISKAARAAQKNRRAFWELIRKHNIDVLPFKSSHP